jgi:hypothetical protein
MKNTNTKLTGKIANAKVIDYVNNAISQPNAPNPHHSPKNKAVSTYSP